MQARDGVNACTIVAPNYLPYARVLARSFLEHHPDGRFCTLVLDVDELTGADEPFEVLGPYDIGVPRAEVHRMAAIYDVKELSTAVKPFLLAHLLDSSATEVVYFDPDIQVFAPVDDIARLAREHALVLTPHLLEPLPRDGLLPSERTILRCGIFNLGFVAVSRSARPFLDWWSERLARYCLVAVERGLFVDQRWVDLATGIFLHHILRDPACNVAYWNVSERDVRGTGERYEVDGRPLRFFHFSGFRPEAPNDLSAHTNGLGRTRLADVPAVARLCEEYAARLYENGYGDEHRRYAFDTLPDGRLLDLALRRAYRDELLAAERDGRPLPPDPFDPASAPDLESLWAAAGERADTGARTRLASLRRRLARAGRRARRIELEGSRGRS